MVPSFSNVFFSKIGPGRDLNPHSKTLNFLFKKLDYKIYILIKIYKCFYRSKQNMKDNEMTTIAVSRSTKEALEKLKVHHNQSYDEVIREILKKLKEWR